MPYRTDITYCYDGSLAGLMCCIHESYYRSELPEVIFTLEEEQGTIFEIRHIETNQEHARKVETAISAKISSEALDLIQKAFLTQLPRKEIHILSFLRLGFQKGAKILTMLTDDRVAVLHKAVSHLEKESALYRGFVRFSEIGGILVSVIEPKNSVLPLILNHFGDRYPEETFIVYDRTHSMMLLGEKGRTMLGYVDHFEPGEADCAERGFRRLWQSFYDAIGIKERENPRCRMSHMPKRYWTQMTEFQERETAPIPLLPDHNGKLTISDRFK